MAPLAGRFPWLSFAAAVLVGIPALLIAGICAVLIWTWAGPQSDVLILNNHVVGGTGDKLAVIALGTVSGGGAMVSLLTAIGRVTEWHGARSR